MPIIPHPLPLGAQDKRAQQFMVAMRDGVRLATDVYLPDESHGGPAVLIRTPYDKSAMLTFLPVVAGYFNDHGYTVIIQDVRGKGRSEGVFRAFEAEVDDGFDTLEWVTEQPWSNGEVVMTGDSYFGFTCWAAVASGHPALKAIAPRGIATDVSAMANPDGVPALAMLAFFGVFALDHRTYAYDLPLDWSTRPLKDIIGAWIPGKRSATFDDFRQAPKGDRFWNAPYFQAVRADRIRVPALHIGAWFDEFRNTQMSDWRIARASSDAPQYLRVEVADHTGNRLWPDGSPFVDFHETEEGLRSHMSRYLDPVIAFFDREVRGIDNGPISPVVVEVAEAGVWEGETWPPVSARAVRYQLADGARAAVGPTGGSLAVEGDGAEHTTTWVHDPQNLVPFLPADPIAVLYGIPPDEREVEGRDDVLTFTGEAATDAVDLMGPVRVSLAVTADAPVIQVAAKLVDVFPDGRARFITDGIRQISRPDPTEPVAIDLKDVAYRLLPGHRLRLEVAASCFPRYLPVINPEGDSWSATTGPQVEYRLRTGGGADSFLQVTVADEVIKER